jgi:Repeat of unknown function (DUF5907)
MPTLGNALDFAKYEGRNLRTHQLGAAPSTPVSGQLYYNTADNTLYWWDGSQWVSARGGAAATPPATNASLGTIQLAGDLAGTATSPQIAAGVITDAEVNGANKDGAAATPSLRTLGTGAQQAAVGSHTHPPNAIFPNLSDNDRTAILYTSAGGYVNQKISDLYVVPANKDGVAATPSMRTLGLGALQAMAGNTPLNLISSPTGDVALSSNKITFLGDPVASTDAANKQYVDNLIQGLDAKNSARVIATTPITLNGAQTVDGIVLNNGDRILVTAQASAPTNGVYIQSAGAWSRAPDMDTWNEIPASYVWIEQGTQYADTGWLCTNDIQGGVLGTTPITWVQFSGASQITSGAGLTKTGNTLDVGAGPGITVNADTVQVANNGITNAMIADGAINLATADVTGTLPLAGGGTGQTTAKTARETGLGATGYFTSAVHGAGATITITAATHGLRASRGLLVQVQDETSGAVEIPDIVVAANGDITVTYGASVAANSKRVTVIG